jgi:hypothetical protein
VNYWSAQLILAARDSNERDTGWMQILVFVILSIFYAVGSIVKARANKTAPKGKEQIPRKLASRRSRGPGRKPPESAIDLQMLKQFFGLPEEEPESSSRPGPEVSKPLVRAKRPAVARQVAMPQVQPKLEKVTAGVAMPLVTAERAVAGAEIPQTKYLSEILSDYEDPEKLRRAILHYEILGKPLSLRDPSEHIIGL